MSKTVKQASQELKLFSKLSLLFAWITGPATDPIAHFHQMIFGQQLVWDIRSIFF